MNFDWNFRTPVQEEMRPGGCKLPHGLIDYRIEKEMLFVAKDFPSTVSLYISSVEALFQCNLQDPKNQSGKDSRSEVRIYCIFN